VAASRGRVAALRVAAHAVARWRRAGLRVAFTNGIFDWLHPGHLKVLREARRKGDVLVVGLNSDSSVRRLKGPGRPICTEQHRARVLAALQAVDYIVLFDDSTPERPIRAVRPDVLVGQRVDIWHYGDYRQNTWAVGLVDFYFQGGYSEKPEDARDPGPFIEREVRGVTDRWPRPMPIVFWETGMNIHDLPTAELDELQALQIVATDKKVKALDLSGWMWWTWRGYCMGKAALNFGIVRADGTPRPAVLALTRETHGE
jgi:rfaE bifunctional protein nucleotidyltransferase chain/domain